MPYVYRDELGEDEVAADVVERADYDAVIQERDELVTQRDGLVERAETAEKGWAESRNKYADAFLTSPARVKREQEADVQQDSVPYSYQQLFDMRGDTRAY